MLIPRFVVWIFAVGMMVLSAGAVFAQDYPNKVIRIVATGAGSFPDVVARLIAQALTGSLGQRVIVENRGITAPELVAKAPPDGYTLLVYTSVVWLLPFLQENVVWDPVRDFSPVTLAASSPSIIVVHPSLPVKSVNELIALAKARPGELNYSSSSIGSATHLAPELFKAMADVNIVRINYKGAGPALAALLSGEVHLMFPSAGGATPHIKSGRLRALAVASLEPSALAPGLPTLAATGLSGFEAATLVGMFAPAKTPATLIHRLNQESVQALQRAEVKERISGGGGEVVASSPEEFAAKIKSEMVKWGKVIKDAGIHPE